MTVNTSLRAHEIEYLLRQSETSTLVTIRGFRGVDYLDSCGAAMARWRRLRGARTHHTSSGGRIARASADDPVRRAARAARAGSPRPSSTRASARWRSTTVINMQYTSGTTGFPKGVMLSSRNIVNNGYWLGAGLGYTPRIACACVCRSFTASAA